MLQSRKKQIEEDVCDVSWYKEMAGRVWEMCHSNSGSVFNSSERTEGLDCSAQPLFVFLVSASWTGSSPLLQNLTRAASRFPMQLSWLQE